MYKVKKPSKRDIVNADMQRFNKLIDAGIRRREDVLNPSPEQLKVLLELGIDMKDVITGRGE